MYLANEPADRGKNLAIGIASVFMGFSIIDLAAYAVNISNVGIEGVASQLVKLIISSFLVYYFFKGSGWAKIIIGIVLLVDSAAYLLRIAEAIISSAPVTLFMAYISFALAAKLIAGILLFSSKNIRKYLEFIAKLFEQEP